MKINFNISVNFPANKTAPEVVITRVVQNTPQKDAGAPKNCLGCGQTFVTNRSYQKFHNEACGGKYRREHATLTDHTGTIENQNVKQEEVVNSDSPRKFISVPAHLRKA